MTHDNVVNRAIAKVLGDGFTRDKGYELTLGVSTVTVTFRVGQAVAATFNYDKWEYEK